MTVKAVLAAPPAMAGYAKPTPLPAQFVHLGVASLYPVTPSETISTGDVAALETLLYRYAAGTGAESATGLGGGVSGGLSEVSLIKSLTEAYGASGHEEKVREQVKKLLPGWAKPETDAAGNLVLKPGSAKANSSAPKVVFVAHMDEIGYQVRSIEPDGRLLMDVLGGGYTEYFLGHVMLLQKVDGNSVAGVLELPSGWCSLSRHLSGRMDRRPWAIEAVHLYVGTHSVEETQKLGIKVGDWATIPKNTAR